MDETSDPTGAGILAGFIAYLFVGIVYAIIVYVIARKRKVNPWPWAIPTLIPAIGLIVAAIFYLLSFLSILDRLNALEERSTFS